MASNANGRAAELAAKATELIENGDLTQASKVLREASSLGPGNPDVGRALEALHEGSGGRDALSRLCRKWMLDQSDENGEDILDHIHQNTVSNSVGTDAMDVMLDYHGDLDMADQITGALLKNRGAQEMLIKHMITKPTETFGRLFDRGDDSIDALTDLLFDKTAWPSEKERVAAERDAFQLALAQMMLAGQDHPERAMKCIARLLNSENQNLKGLMDADGFDVILSQLDIRAPSVLRSQATLATAKLLELSRDTSERLISQYVIKRVERPSGDALVLAFSAAAVVFPMAPTAAAQLSLNQGFLKNFESLMHRFTSSRVEQAALEFLNAACLDTACRKAIRTYCLKWVTEISQHASDDNKRSNQAAVILVKVRQDEEPSAAGAQGEHISASVSDPKTQAEFVSRFKSLIVNANSDQDATREAVEGLVYSSIQPKTKKALATDSDFLQALMKVTKEKTSVGEVQFGCLTIMNNLTSYLPQLSEEQKKLSQLKSYANSQKPRPPDVLDQDSAVTARCSAVLQAGAVASLVSAYKNASPGTKSLTVNILDNLAREKTHRGIMAQQGAVKLLLMLFDQYDAANSTDAEMAQAKQTAAHALARILISVNPNHVFGSSGLPISSAIRPLVHLITPDPNLEAPNLLPVFESLLALTNLASTDDDARDSLIRLAWTQLEDLLLSSNTLVQRASVELVCNLCASGAGVAKFADGSKQAGQRLHILLALADAEDFATRRAAGGALAMLTEWDAAAKAVIERERGIKILLDLCADDSEECRHRGVVCVHNLAFAPDDLAKKGRETLKANGAIEILRLLVVNSKVQEIIRTAVEVLQVLG